MKNYVQSGDVITVTADRDIASCELVVAGALVGYAQADALTGAQVAIVTEGVFRVNVAAAAAVSVGDVIYIDGQTLTTEADDGEVDPVEFPRAGLATLGGAPDAGFAEIHLKLNG